LWSSSPPFFVTYVATCPHRPVAMLTLWTLSPPFLSPTWQPAPIARRQCLCCGLQVLHFCNSRHVPHRPRGDTVFVAYIVDFQHPFCFVAHVASPIAREAILLLIGRSPLSASFAPGYSWSSFPFTSSMARMSLLSGSCRCRARNLTNQPPSAVVTHSMPSAVYPNSCGSRPLYALVVLLMEFVSRRIVEGPDVVAFGFLLRLCSPFALLTPLSWLP
jgi:hypothetical protein